MPQRELAISEGVTLIDVKHISDILSLYLWFNRLTKLYSISALIGPPVYSDEARKYGTIIAKGMIGPFSCSEEFDRVYSEAKVVCRRALRKNFGITVDKNESTK